MLGRSVTDGAEGRNVIVIHRCYERCVVLLLVFPPQLSLVAALVNHRVGLRLVSLQVWVDFTVGHQKIDDSCVEAVTSLTELRLCTFVFLHERKFSKELFNLLTAFYLHLVRCEALRCL